ncbi:MAG: 3-phosphoshikimate 1-carboxyvinyltransferase, partial [Spirochaetia bacterium]|nr:3-phosphoshikimate 1-carboxyvinyltransferase [Spirochaetia bacterium]
ASGDGLSALDAAKAFGAVVQVYPDSWVIEGLQGKPRVPENCIDTKNSGTTTCFFTSVAALVENGYTVITGDEQIRHRPIKVLVDALTALGVTAFLTRIEGSAPPVVVKGPLRGGEVLIQGFNSQYVSSLLLSAPLSKTSVSLSVENALEKPYVQMTLDWMKKFGVSVSNPKDYTAFFIQGGQQYQAGTFTIPADWSAVAFPLVAAAITKSNLLLTGLDFADSQGDKRVVQIMQDMGCQLLVDSQNGTIRVTGGRPLTGGLIIDMSDIPDALPALMVFATQASGTTIFTNLAHVRLKETDRVLEMQQKLTYLGCNVRLQEEALIVEGPTEIQSKEVSSSFDHRIAMALFCAGLCAENGLIINDVECASVSFPHFFESFQACGAQFDIQEAMH